MNFKVEKKEIYNVVDGDLSDVYLIKSTAPKRKHRLFLEWDDKGTENTKILEALGIGGILINTPRGYHFIANVKPMSLEDTLTIQRLFGADAKWIRENRNTRKCACLRVSQKYDDEPPLRVLDSYPYTDEKLKQKYEEIIQEYFYRGDPYYVNSDWI